MDASHLIVYAVMFFIICVAAYQLGKEKRIADALREELEWVRDELRAELGLEDEPLCAAHGRPIDFAHHSRRQCGGVQVADS